MAGRARGGGFSVDAEVRIKAGGGRSGLGRLLRYRARPRRLANAANPSRLSIKVAGSGIG